MAAPIPDFDALRQRLSAHAFLFDDPSAYTAGVEQTIAAVQRALGEQRSELGRFRNRPGTGEVTAHVRRRPPFDQRPAREQRDFRGFPAG